jgi:hypothetical protein
LSYIAETTSVCGVIAYSSPFKQKSDWRKLFSGCNISYPEKSYQHPYEKTNCPFYVNLGFVAVPTTFIPYLNEYLPYYLELTDKIFPGHYHRPQLAMCLAIQKLPCTALPLRCNYPDLFDDMHEGIDKALIIHLLRAKSLVHNWDEVRTMPAYNEVGKRVQSRLKMISKLRSL